MAFTAEVPGDMSVFGQCLYTAAHRGQTIGIGHDKRERR